MIMGRSTAVIPINAFFLSDSLNLLIYDAK